eukprot:602555-Pleurochrysis_carterae.AAC.1
MPPHPAFEALAVWPCSERGRIRLARWRARWNGSQWSQPPLRAIRQAPCALSSQPGVAPPRKQLVVMEGALGRINVSHVVFYRPYTALKGPLALIRQ